MGYYINCDNCHTNHHREEIVKTKTGNYCGPCYYEMINGLKDWYENKTII